MKPRHHLLFFITVVIGAILLFFSSELLLPVEIRNVVFRSPKIDTIGHFIGFFILAWVVHSVIKLSLFNTILTLILYGALSELGQFYLGFRNGEFSDFFADVCGILFFALLKWCFVVYGGNFSQNKY